MSSAMLRRLAPTRSLYVAVFLAMMTTLTLSFFIFRQISLRLERQHFDLVYDRLDRLQLASAEKILKDDGPGGLQDYLDGLDHVSGSHHYLLNSAGVDVLTGTNRSVLLPPAPARIWRIQKDGHAIAAQLSADGQYWFAAFGTQRRSWIWAYFPYYLLVAGATASLCWLASIAVVLPVRRIAACINLFGRGNLDARVNTQRRDEIGQLGKSFDQMAEHVQRMIVTERRLLADVSHELRSPLTRLKMGVRLARTSSDLKEALDRIDRDTDRISSLVAEIVEVASAEGDFDDRKIENVSLESLMDEVLVDCSLEAESRGCTIALHGKPEGEIVGNRELLRRCIENVLRNSVRHSPAHSSVEVFIAPYVTNGDVEVAIRDYGPGVPPPLLERIFDPFFRGEEAATSSEGGSGLGLSIARRAVRFHGGTIAAKNAHPGLRVEITLPRTGGHVTRW